MANLIERTFSKKGLNPNIKKQKQDIIEKYIAAYEDLISKDEFLSWKYVDNILRDYQDQMSEMSKLHQSGVLIDYCKRNGINYEVTLKAALIYHSIKDNIKRHNDQYVERKLKEEKSYLDNVLKVIDSDIILDEEQRQAVINDQDYCMIIAGAGAGKTTTVAAKVKYLVDRKGVDPTKILVISFTNKAVNELKDRINKKLAVPCPVTTFHSCGNAIIRKTKEEKLNVAPESSLFFITRDYLTNIVSKDYDILKKLVIFFSYYFEFPFSGTNIDEYIEYRKYSDYTTLKSNLGEINRQIIDKRTKRKNTIKNESVKSMEEVQIANFLYMNGIEYEYERPYPYHIPGATKIYTPDFYIHQNGRKCYLEHFGISESGENSRFTPLELLKYKKCIADKQYHHARHHTQLISTYSKYNDKRPLLTHLKEELLKAGFKLIPRNEEEVYRKLTKNKENKYYDKMVRLICRFILNYKIRGYDAKQFTTFYNNTDNVRTKLFLEICEKIYLEYQRILKEKNMVDFADMINDSAALLREVKALKQKIDFDYIFVDEYQDISRQRFNLTKELAGLTNAKIIAVGDDWQSIYAFAGSEIELFTRFEKEMGYADVLPITHTYRNAQELIDIAGDFIQQNPQQIKKKLLSPKSIRKPIVIHSYSDNYKKNPIRGKTGVMEQKGKLLEKVLGNIIQVDGNRSSILLIGRYNFDAANLGKSSYFEYDKEANKLYSIKYPDLNLTFMTAHSSKGLSYDNVVIINAANEVYGFPAQIDNDPVMDLVTFNDRSYEFSEERRLFYVAMTRTRERVFILSPELRPSRFVLELMKYPNIVVHGKIETDYKEIKKYENTCPICGYPLQFQINKNYGLKMFICMNDSEVCDFITNDLNGGAATIKICPDCKDGYLIIRKNANEDNYFLGCTNYNNGMGCLKTEPIKNKTI